MFEQQFAAQIADVAAAALSTSHGLGASSAPPPTRLPHALAARACTALGITQTEFDVVWSLAAAMYHGPLAAALSARGHAPPGISLVMHATWWQLSEAELIRLRQILAPTHPLQLWGIMRPLDGFASVTTRLVLDASFAARLSGAPTSFTYTLVPPLLSHAQEAMTQRLAELLAKAQAMGTPATLLVTGAADSGRGAACALAAAPTHVAHLDFDAHPLEQWPSLVQALLREAQLTERVPLLENFDDSQLARPALKELHAYVRAYPGPIFITLQPSAAMCTIETRPSVRLTWPQPDASTRRRLWQAALTAHGERAVRDDQLDELASRYALGPGAITRAVASARLAARNAGMALEARDLYAGIHGNTATQLAGLATHVPVTQAWDELVLSPELHADLNALLARIEAAPRALDEWGFREKLPRGAGVAALFSGPPGTGKTMVAGLLARHLGFELYQVDLSNIVSKWVGETEKQLARLFDAAEAGHVLLLFDEADSLFAKRSADVRSATDRYANLEVNYLLQCIEQFSGMAVLTTNFEANLDPALRRRLAAHLVFTHPDEPEREQLWQRLLRTNVPPSNYLDDDIKPKALARDFAHLTGATIRNAVLSAAFHAAHTGTRISMRLLQQAAQREYRAMGRVLARVQTSL